MKYQPYRDEPFQRDCESRYETIKPVFDKFKRRFSVLDIGANHGWFGHRLVEDYDCVYFAIDNKVIDPHPRIWHIKRHMTGAELLALSRCEHFDVVLSLAVLHHIPDYEMAFQAMMRLGQHVIYEIPGEDDVNAANRERHEGIKKLFDGPPFTYFDSHVSDSKRPVYYAVTTPFISEQTIDAPARGACGYATYKILADEQKSIIEIDRRPVKSTLEVRDYIPGMNAHNFRLLGGEVDIPSTPSHPDDKPWNYILSDGIWAIDHFHQK